MLRVPKTPHSHASHDDAKDRPCNCITLFKDMLQAFLPRLEVIPPWSTNTSPT